tara:strand:+ start:207 stop:479 length:273 start_codon:yes stop_codon:yes gene_type:complete
MMIDDDNNNKYYLNNIYNSSSVISKITFNTYKVINIIIIYYILLFWEVESKAISVSTIMCKYSSRQNIEEDYRQKQVRGKIIEVASLKGV